ncbi:MAG: hypothetical protein ABSE82_04725 [Nitrososphaerales archaeon]|jgi:hypothetical protein
MCIVLGATFAYEIYKTSLIPQLVPPFYFMAGLLMFVGIVILVAKFQD